MTNEYANNGFFGSKNNFGIFCAILVIASLSVLVDKTRNSFGTLVATIGLLVGIALIVQAKSLGALLTCLLSASVVIGGVLVRPVRPGGRLPIIIGLGLAALLVFGMIFAAVGGLDPLLALVGKSAGLTGRTTLWEQARREWDMRPFLGLGYQAFWVQGSAEAEALWKALHVSGRMGFHFHNTFYAVAVELGSIGLWVFILTILAIGRNVFRAALMAPTGTQLFLTSLFVLMVLRLPVEVDALIPFSHGTFFLPVIYVYSNQVIAEASRRGSRD